jgi:hypothetical protein
MKIPKKITIGGVQYLVEIRDEDNIETDALGICECNDSKILLKKDMNKDLTFKTFVHEVLHAIVFEYGVIIEEDDEELLINQLTTGVFEFIKQLNVEK